MSKKLPYPEWASKSYSHGTKPERRRIKSCSNGWRWYAGKIGEIITVHYFATYGCWDIKGRWIHYYDLSEPITDEPKPKSLFKRIFG